MASTRATVGYLLTSQRMTFAGLTVDDRMVFTADEEAMRGVESSRNSFAPVGNEIRIDATVYQGIGRMSFDVQDNRGLIGVTLALPLLTTRALEASGPTARAARGGRAKKEW